MKFYHKEIQEDIDRKLETKKRPKHFLLFVDLKKAFDTINRAKLIENLYEKKVNETVVNAVRQIYSKTLMQTNERRKPVQTSKGVMQGGVLSPKLFALYINDMLTALNSYGIAAWALADDIVIATRGEYHLSLAVKTLR